MTNFTDVEQSPYSAPVKISDEIVQEFAALLPFEFVRHIKYSEIDRALTAILPKLMVKARQLEWTDHHIHDGRRQWQSKGVETITETHPLWPEQGYVLFYEKSTYATLDEAKAAAQADYERRLLEGLEIVKTDVDVAAVRRQAFEDGFEDAIEQSLGALHSYDDITRNEADHAIRKLKPDYRALSAEPAPEAGR